MDPDIKWEQTRPVNVGLDFGFANQRITGAIDYYDKLTDDLLFTVPVARVQQPVELRHHQHRQHAELRASSSASVPGSWMAGSGG